MIVPGSCSTRASAEDEEKARHGRTNAPCRSCAVRLRRGRGPVPGLAQSSFRPSRCEFYIGFVRRFHRHRRRIVGAELSEAFGVQVIADNRPGANGAIAARAHGTRRPDGYTF